MAESPADRDRRRYRCHSVGVGLEMGKLPLTGAHVSCDRIGQSDEGAAMAESPADKGCGSERRGNVPMTGASVLKCESYR